MKVLFPTILLLVIMSVPLAGAGNDDMVDDIWELRDITVIAFPSNDISIQEMDDGWGINLAFTRWSDAYHKTLVSSLEKTSISHNIHLLRQGQATVELYSENGAVKFNQKIDGRTTQVIIGNERAELYPIRKLLDSHAAIPMADDVVDHLKHSQLIKARKSLYTVVAKEKYEKKLLENRLTLLTAAVRGGEPLECELIQTVYHHPEELEAALLNAVCHYLKHNLDNAETILKRLHNHTTDDHLRSRIHNLRQEFIRRSVMDNTRRQNSEQVAGYFLRFSDIDVHRLFSVQGLEAIAALLRGIGLSSLVAQHMDDLISRMSNAMLKNAAPLIAETYLNSGQYIKALDVANYYIERPLAAWARARLLLIRGHVHLQQGSWRSAISDLETAQQLASLQLRDKIALMESYIRLGMKPPFEIVIDPNTPQNRRWIPWLQRLQKELKLYTPHRIPPSDLDKLPDYALYKALLFTNEHALKQHRGILLKALSKRTGIFSQLAKMELELDDAQRRMTFIKAGKTI